MTSVLLIDHHVDPALGSAVERAVRQMDAELRRWAPGQTPDLASPPQVVVATLSRGTRRMPATVSHLADEIFPGTPVLLLSEEPLVQPYLLLQGGRLTLLSHPQEPAVLAERVAAAAAWGLAAVAPAASSAAVQRRDLRSGRGRASLVMVGSSAGHVAVNTTLGLTAVASGLADQEQVIERDLLPTLDAWHDQPDSDQLRRALGLRSGSGWKSFVHLDPEAGRWLLAAPGHWPLVLAASLRLPAWWTFPASVGDRVRVLAAEPGDVVLIGAPLPEFAGFSAPALALAADGGAAALADHLAETAIKHGCAVAAVALEVRA